MRKRIMMCGLVGLMLAPGIARAEISFNAARVEALGNAVLVLEDETTELNIFNLGNPAGAAFLPAHNRMDLLAAAGQSQSELEFIGNSLTASLEPGRVYRQLSKQVFASLDAWQGTGYGGYLAWLTPEVVVQFLPRAAYVKDTQDELGDDWQVAAGGAVRAAWRLADVWSLGAGFTALPSQEQGPSELIADAQVVNPAASSDVFRRGLDLQVQLGTNLRLNAVFDPQDRMDLALQLNAAERKDDLEQTFTEIAEQPLLRQTVTGYPLEAALQAVYDYKGVLDAGLVIGYQRAREFRAWSSQGLGDRETFASSDLENIDYEASLRVRLPMAHEDDLRFGIIFNNRGVGHPFPTGSLVPVSAETLETQPVVETASSSIGIGMAVVPVEDAIVALEYRIGSSLSKQGDATRADSGYTRFAFGAQYEVIEGFFLRLGFTSEQVKRQFEQEEEDNISRLSEIDAFRIGVGWASGPWRVDLTAIGSRSFRSPFGWDAVSNPREEFEGLQDRTRAYTGLLGVTYALGLEPQAADAAE